STAVGGAETARELVAQVTPAEAGRTADLALLFASAHFEDELEKIAAEIHDLLRPRAFIGATGEAVIGGDQEFEHQPAITLWSAHLPGATATSFHLSEDELAGLDTAAGLQEHLGVRAEERPYFVMLGDPYTFSGGVMGLLELLAQVYPGRPTIGGMASAAEQPGQNALVFDGQVLRHGLVGVALRGNVRVDTVVSQGCRPIGRHMVITKADRNVIYQLGGRPPLAVVSELLNECPPHDIELARARGLLVGRVINEYQKSFSRGDFLIRNPIGFDSNSGAMAVNDLVRTGQTIQFHVRDGESASEDLSLLLAAARREPAAGALLFSCNGRGTRLFAQRHHDARAVRTSCGGIPLAGFFCAGEIGPVGERNFLHGHTASLGLFRPAEPQGDA
ncbi:MAG: FIST signal transduction protein, partial [Dongiaceae bacterium]